MKEKDIESLKSATLTFESTCNTKELEDALGITEFKNKSITVDQLWSEYWKQTYKINSLRDKLIKTIEEHPDANFTVWFLKDIVNFLKANIETTKEDK
jgi:hypothetical protein